MFDLPPRSVFEPPSYPNVWFYVRDTLVASHVEAVNFVIGWLRDRCGIKNDFIGFKPPEASDTQARLHGLQPWREASNPMLNHAHDLHIRYYYIALRQQHHERVPAPMPAGRHYFRFAGSPTSTSARTAAGRGCIRARKISSPACTSLSGSSSFSTARFAGIASRASMSVPLRA